MPSLLKWITAAILVAVAHGKASHRQPLRMLRLRGGEEVATGGRAEPSQHHSGEAFGQVWNGNYESFVQHRLKVFERVKAEREAEKKSMAAKLLPIKITLPDGSTQDGVEGVTSPHDVATTISKRLADACVAAKVNGELWDLMRPIEGDCTLKLLKFDDDEGKEVFWHSSAHVLGQALEKTHGAHLVKGPAIEEGFFYDVYTGNDTISIASSADIESTVTAIVGDAQPFERITLTKEEALEMFDYNPFKVEMISRKVPDGEKCTAYRCGPLIDLCRGPHLPTTGHVKAFSVTKNSAAVWKSSIEGRGESALQRVYGVSFPDKKALKEYTTRMEEAKKRDHREIGRKQELFMFHPLSPGSAFFLPHGTRIYNRLQALLREEYAGRGFDEVISPNVFNMQLWERSGHAAHYKDNMFLFDQDDKEVMGLKPMNCPGHCLIFASKVRSYRDLPLRYADFGVLHRNEPTGALTGLTRVRRFQQDDAHIFCRPEHVQAEISDCLSFISSVYAKVGLGYELLLSTRPEQYIGSVDQWDGAEASLKAALEATGRGWQLRPGDGAFYGPKIDVLVLDALKRKHQCATIQLDFQLPQRFNLTFHSPDLTGAEGSPRPVIIHRAVLGSLERFIAILTEHTAGLYADVDESDNTISKKIRESQMAQYNYILVVGKQEEAGGTVNVRTRDNVVHGIKPLEGVICDIKAEVARYE